MLINKIVNRYWSLNIPHVQLQKFIASVFYNFINIYSYSRYFKTTCLIMKKPLAISNYVTKTTKRINIYENIFYEQMIKGKCLMF